MMMLTFAAFLVDWAGKSWALKHFEDAVLPLGGLTIGVVRNEGFAFSVGHGLMFLGGIALARVAVVALLLLLCYRVAAMLSRRHGCGAALIAAGGLGNAMDLVFRGGVVDFISVGPIPVDGPAPLAQAQLTFNPADLFILVGLALLAPLIQRAAKVTQQRIARWERRILR
ncbi:MAG: signal peptidase II [Gemmatimonadota bacterium]|jgi:lipoprotein signal peptidase